MAQNALLIHYEYCSGCHSCEVACRNEHNIPLDKWGIKLTEVGPWQVDDEQWEWNYIPVPTALCDMCEDRVAAGKKPTCVHHCLAQCMEFGPVEDMAKRMAELGSKVTMFLP